MPGKYDKGDGPEYVTLGKFGPNLGIDSVESVIRLNNICNDLGLDTASTGSAIGWAFELFQRGIITEQHTGGLALQWGDAGMVEKLLFMMAARAGFGNVLADSTRAVENGHYSAEALKYRIAVKNLGQSDPHDARILKAFALGLAVATRGMDHLRNRVTLEINARINDNPEFKRELYGGPVSAEPTSYVDKERAVRACEDIYAVGDAVGMCRFTTKLFNSPSLPGLEEFREQLENVTGLQFTAAELERCGLNIMGVERLINHRLGVRRKDDTLPDRWFDEPNPSGPYKGEKIDRREFDAMLTRFYEISRLTSEGVPDDTVRTRTDQCIGDRQTQGFVATGGVMAITVNFPAVLHPVAGESIVVRESVATVGQLLQALDRLKPGIGKELDDPLYNIAVNDEILLHAVDAREVRDGDVVEIIPSMAGG